MKKFSVIEVVATFALLFALSLFGRAAHAESLSATPSKHAVACDQWNAHFGEWRTLKTKLSTDQLSSQEYSRLGQIAKFKSDCQANGAGPVMREPLQLKSGGILASQPAGMTGDGFAVIADFTDRQCPGMGTPYDSNGDLRSGVAYLTIVKTLSGDGPRMYGCWHSAPGGLEVNWENGMIGLFHPRPTMYGYSRGLR